MTAPSPEEEPYLGKQEDPVPGVTIAGWVPSPGHNRVIDKRYWPKLNGYVTDLVGSYGGDPRVLAWDLYNEPANSGTNQEACPLVEAAFNWARLARPLQPLTVGVLEWDSSMSELIMKLSDIVSFHCYDPPESMTAKIEFCRKTQRPVVCTEWLRRQGGVLSPRSCQFSRNTTLAGITGVWWRGDTDLFGLGIQEGRSHAESLATRYFPSRRDAVRSSGNQFDTKLATTIARPASYQGGDKRGSHGQCRSDRGLFSGAMPQGQSHATNLNWARRHCWLVQGKIVVARPPPEEPTVRTALTVVTPLDEIGCDPHSSKSPNLDLCRLAPQCHLHILWSSRF